MSCDMCRVSTSTKRRKMGGDDGEGSGRGTSRHHRGPWAVRDTGADPQGWGPRGGRTSAAQNGNPGVPTAPRIVGTGMSRAHRAIDVPGIREDMAQEGIWSRTKSLPEASHSPHSWLKPLGAPASPLTSALVGFPQHPDERPEASGPPRSRSGARRRCHFPWVHVDDAGRHGGPDACPLPALCVLPGGGSLGTELLPGGRSSGTELLSHPLWCPLSACLGGR